MKYIFAISALALAAVPSFGSDLWDQQSGIVAASPNAVNTVFSDFPTYSTFVLSEVTVGTGGWNVTSISELVALNNTTAADFFTSADLNIIAVTGALPGSNPVTSDPVAVTVTGTSTAGVYLETATLNTHLAAGSYWIGLTASGAFATNGEAYSYYSTSNSAGASAGDVIINPGGSIGLASAGSYETLATAAGSSSPEYAAIDIQGTQAVPEPISLSLLGLSAVGLITRRRK